MRISGYPTAWLRAPIALFLFALVAIGSVTAAALGMSAAVRKSNEVLERATLDLGEAERLRGLRERVSRKARTFLLAGDDKYLQELREADQEFQLLLSMRRAAAKTASELGVIDRIAELDQARRRMTDELIDARQSGATAVSIANTLESELQPTLAALDAIIGRMVEYHQHNVGRVRTESMMTSSGAVRLVWAATALAVLASALSSFALARTLRRIEGGAMRTRRHLAAIVESSEDAVYSKDLDGNVLTWNRSAARVFGYEPGEIIGQHVSILSPPDLAEDIPKILSQIRAGQPVPHLETLRRAKDGRLVEVVLAVSPIRDEAGAVIGASIIARDITEQRRLRRERDRFFELSLDMVCIAGTDGFFKQLNPTFQAILGYTRDELLGRPFIELVHPDDRTATLLEIERLAAGQRSLDFENRYRCRDGSHRWLCWHASAEADGTIYAVARDVTERKATQEKLIEMAEELRVMAVVDELTGLHNRRGFNVLAEQELSRVRRGRQKASFFFADIDGLKQINDELGHDVGDRAICAAAAVFRSAFRSSDIIARLGGDEFVVLCTDAAVASGVPLARVEQMVREYNASTPTRPFKLSISIGWTIHDPEHPEPLDSILKRADRVMYEEKARRKASSRAVV